jgi:hypothetical protein
MKTTLKKLKIAALLAVIILSTFNNKVIAQIFTGGDLSATFINGVNVDIAPIVGYKYKSFSAGLSPVVLYTASSPDGIAGEFSYGGRVFAEYDVWNGILVHAEFEAMNVAYLKTENGISFKQRGWIMGAPIGVGYEYEIASHVWFKGMVLYDVLLDIDINQSSPKANPTLRGGITYVF